MNLQNSPTGSMGSSNTASVTPQIHNLLNTNNNNGGNNNNGNNTGNMPLSNSSFSNSPSPIDNVTNHDDLTQPNKQNDTVKKKLRRKSSSANDDKTLLSTSSPEGIAAANEITPNRIANILIKEGPLPIRHLTAHLTQQVPAFGNLSLSKQRRLIMASLESGDIVTGCVFEKIGWGQWEAKLVGKDAVKVKIENHNNQLNILNNNNGSNGNNGNNNDTSYNNISDQSFINPRNQVERNVSDNIRRGSITNSAINDHNIKLPTSPTLSPIQDLRNSLKNYNSSHAIESSSSSPSSENDDDDDVDEFDDGFNLRNTNSDSPPNFDDYRNDSKMANIKSKLIRSTSMSSAHRPSFAGVSKPRKPRSSFTQYTLEAALDDAPMERRESRVSFSNSNNLSRQSFLRTNISPRLSNNNSTISVALENENAIVDEDFEGAIIDTDEEDWKSIGPSSLRKNKLPIASPPPPANISHNNNKKKTDEEMAAIALMDLKTV